MAAPHKQMKTAAIRFLQGQPRAESPLDLPVILGRCQLELMSRFKMPGEDAYRLAVAAWSEVEGRRTGFHIALEISTPWLIFVVDPFTDQVRPVPIVDLVDALHLAPGGTGSGPAEDEPPPRPRLRLVHDAAPDDPPPAA